MLDIDILVFTSCINRAYVDCRCEHQRQKEGWQVFIRAQLIVSYWV